MKFIGEKLSSCVVPVFCLFIFLYNFLLEFGNFLPLIFIICCFCWHFFYNTFVSMMHNFIVSFWALICDKRIAISFENFYCNWNSTTLMNPFTLFIVTQPKSSRCTNKFSTKQAKIWTLFFIFKTMTWKVYQFSN